MIQTKVVEKIKTHILCSVNVFLKSRRLRDNVGKTLYSKTGHQYIFLIVSPPVLLRTRNVPDKRCRENQNTHFVFSKCFPKIAPFTRKCGKNPVQHDRPPIYIFDRISPCSS